MSGHKVVIITGASAGIGAALAKLLASRGGYDVVIAARRAEELSAVAAACEAAGTGCKALAIVADVTKRQDFERLVSDTIAKFGRVDVLVNNVGLGITKSVLDLSEEDIDMVLGANLKSALYGIQSVMPHFKAQQCGHIVNISSFLGRCPAAPFRSIYSASKAALNSLTSNLRMDLKATFPNIHVTTVLPGIVLTDFGKNAIGGAPTVLIPAMKEFVSTFKPQTADAVALVIADAIAQPVDGEVYTNPNMLEAVKSYVSNVEGYESRYGQV
jgi:NAD(P)-dependent dehydrogenase (short-subunit alcohol dehydrogenase family)